MLSGLLRQLAHNKCALLAAVLASRTTNASTSRSLDTPPPTESGGSQRKVDLSSIQDAAAAYSGVIIEGFQGDIVDAFSPAWAKDVMDHAMARGRESLQERMDNKQQGIQGDIEPLPPADRGETGGGEGGHGMVSSYSGLNNSGY